jgi:multicomponent Na+:H+ antiporter subunit C
MTSETVIKTVLSFNIVEASLIVLFLNLVALDGENVPIYALTVQRMVDPLPQAMMLTTIVIGAAITALVLMMSIKIFHYFGSLKWAEILERDI